MNSTEIKVNGMQVPINQFVSSIVSKLVFAIVDSLKGIEEKDVKEIIIKVTYD